MQTDADRKTLRRIRDEVQQGKRTRDNATLQEMINCMGNYQISIKIVSQEGTCLGGHKIGDEWLMKDRGDNWKTPSGICMFAYDVLSPCIQMMMFGGSYPWSYDPNVWRAPCPQPTEPRDLRVEATARRIG